MKTAKPETSDINRLVSKILDKPPVEKFEKFDYKVIEQVCSVFM
jgi:hypothetical protein